MRTNIHGTFNLLEARAPIGASCRRRGERRFRFLQVSTDEVYGSLAADDAPFTETTAYAPNSPYAASKAAADHMVRAYHHTYGLPTLTTNCSNNYGPYQFPEKLIPLVILNALAGKADAGLWRRAQRARLALRRRSLRGIRKVLEAGGRARSTTSAATASAAISKWCRRSAPCWTSCARRRGPTRR